MKEIMPVVEKDAKVFMEEFKEFCGYTFLSKQSTIAFVCYFSGSSNRTSERYVIH